MISKEMLGEFVEESFAILTGVKAAVVAPQGGQAAREAIERGLHTIKGNAAAFGFAEMAAGAAGWLEFVRAPNGPGTHPGAADPARLLEFIARAEEFLDLVRDGESPPEGFFRPPPAAGGAGGSKRRARESVDAAAQARTLDPDIEAILATAPAVSPRIDVLAKTAVEHLSHRHEPEPAPSSTAQRSTGTEARRLSRTKSFRQSPSLEAAPQVAVRAERPAPPPPAGDPRAADGSRSDKPIASGAVGYAFEAALAFETVRNLAIHYKSDPRLSGLVANLSEFFKSFSRWGVEVRSVPVGEFLKDVIGWSQKHAESLGRKLTCEVQGKSFTVLPGVGKLVREILKEVLRRLLSTQERPGGPVTARIAIHTSPGYFTLRITGLLGSQRTSAKLHLYSIQEKVEKAGVIVTQGETGNEVLIDIPDNLNSLDVQVLRAGDSVIGVPAHRVISVHEAESIQTGLRGNGWLELKGEKIPVVDLTGDASSGKSPPLVLLRTEGGKLAVKVDAVLEREDMPLQVSAHADWQSDVIGICICPGDFRCIPLLRWSLHG